jgi:serine/threonine protein kinase
MVKSLVSAGALLDKTDEDLNTALHLAIMQENSAITEVIVLNCPNMMMKNKEGLTQMDLLRRNQADFIEDPSEIFTLSEYEEVEIDISLPEGVCRPDRPVTLKDFIAVQQIGKGSFGEVFLVKHKFTGEYFAMKVLKKEKIFAQNLQKYVLAERNILSYINHPFIVHLKFAFQDREKVFLILEYCPGGNLTACIRRFGKLDEDVVRVYLAEILLAVAELHRRGIIYRDLKPDNVVLDSQGHALLADFGLSKEGVLDNVSATSFCGSVAYLAPEMIKRQGHGKPVDWYLFGVVMFEMLTGRPPFYHSDKQLLLYNIEHAKLKVPPKITEHAKDLLKKLLKKDPEKRIGSQFDAEEIKNHQFFDGIDWNLVYSKGLNPPVPPLGSIRTEIVNGYGGQPDEYFEVENRISGWTFVADT